MPVSSAVRRGVLAATATGLAALTLSTALAPPASAYQPSTTYQNAIASKRASLPTSLLYGSFFWVNQPQLGAPDLDGLPGPDGTPDGKGAFELYAGNQGQGAIYAHIKYGQMWAQAIYGNIGQSWRQKGFETGKGYPMSDEYDATSSDLSMGCPAGTVRVQRFQRWEESSSRRACWSPSFNTAWNVVWTS